MWPFSPSYPTVSVSNLRDSYDYIIVGGGTSGCVIARRLSENKENMVLVVERGDASNSWLQRVPLLSDWHTSADKNHAVEHETVDEAGLGRKLTLVVGKGLGGTSRINACQYNRSSPAEYQAWSKNGREWSYEELLPYFVKSEHYLGLKSNFHGSSGRWKTRSDAGYYFPTAQRFNEAASKFGFPIYDDWSEPRKVAVGCAKAVFTIDERGQRSSTFLAFLPMDYTLLHKGNLHICTNALATKLEIKADADGTHRVQGLSIQPNSPSNQAHQKVITITAKREVILCCGALGSPQLLMLSGIGPEQHLRKFSIVPLLHRPGVGKNLSDHLNSGIGFSCPVKASVLGLKNPLILLRQLFQYISRGKGWFLAPMVESCLFADNSCLAGNPSQPPRDEIELPDFALMSVPAAVGNMEKFSPKLGSWSLLASLLRPYSRGRVSLQSANAFDPPACEGAYFTDARDRATLRTAIRLAVKLSRIVQGSGYPIQEVDTPSEEELQDDQKLDNFIRARCETGFHYAGTCRMAHLDDPESPGVVNDHLQVHGVEGLRIADASVLPRVPAAYPQAAVVVVAEKCASMILGHNHLGEPPS